MKNYILMLLVLCLSGASASGEDAQGEFQGSHGQYKATGHAENGVLRLRIYYPDNKDGEEKVPALVDGSIAVIVVYDGNPVVLRKKDEKNKNYLNWTSMAYMRQSAIECKYSSEVNPEKITDVIIFYNESGCIRCVRRK